MKKRGRGKGSTPAAALPHAAGLTERVEQGTNTARVDGLNPTQKWPPKIHVRRLVGWQTRQSTRLTLTITTDVSLNLTLTIPSP